MAVLIVTSYSLGEYIKDFLRDGERTINTNNIDHMYESSENSNYYWVIFKSGSYTAVHHEDFKKLAQAMND
jgi:hypothetical protein